MRSIGVSLSLALLSVSMLAQGISPHRDIRWPANCNNTPGMTYNWVNNTCIDMNAINPATQLTWPAGCNSNNYMAYNYATNACLDIRTYIAAGTTTNLPAGSPATVTQTGTFPNYILNFGIPGGIPGGSLSYPGVVSNGTDGMSMGGVALPTGFMQGTNVAPAYYSPYREIDVVAAGAKGDGRNLATCSIASGAAIVTCPAGVFTAADVGKIAVPIGAGVTNGYTTITGFTDATHVTIGATATTTMAGNMTFRYGTDDNAAITRAINQAMATSSTPLSLYFPKAPGCNGCFYLTSTLTWRSVSMRGMDQGLISGNSVTLHSLPGKDLWNYPDPNDTANTIVNTTVRVENINWTVDNSIDASSAGSNLYPHRKPGKTVSVNVSTTSGSNVVTSTSVGCFQGDVGNQVQITYPDTTTQVSTVTGCNATVTPSGGVTAGTQFTLQNNATQTASVGTTLYISVAGIPATQTIGNCALAIDNRDQNEVNWKGGTTPYVFTYSLFKNVYIQGSAGAYQNNVGGICMQGRKGSGYATTWEHINIGIGLNYGFMLYPSDTNAYSANSSQGCDFCRYVDWKLAGTWPFIVYNGIHGEMRAIQMGSLHGAHILALRSTAESAPVNWDISIPEAEQVVAGSQGFRLEGSTHHVHNSYLLGESVWGAINSICQLCTWSAGNTFKVVGAQNYIELVAVINGALLSGITSLDNSNRIVRTAAGGDRPVAVGFVRDTTALARTADFLQHGGGQFYNNREDLWVDAREVTYVAGATVNTVADPTSDTGYYTAITSAGASIKAWNSLGSQGGTQRPAIGGLNAVMPFTTMNFFLRVKCPVITSFRIAMQIATVSNDTTQGVPLPTSSTTLPTQSCSTTWNTIKVQFDMTTYLANVSGVYQPVAVTNDGTYYPQIQFTSTPTTGEIDWQWMGFAVNGGPTISEWTTPGNSVAGAFTALTNTTRLWSFVLPGNMAPTQITFQPSTADNTATNYYDIGIYSIYGNLICHLATSGTGNHGIAGTTFAPNTSPVTLPFANACNLGAGVRYGLAITTSCASACAAFYGAGNTLRSLNQATPSTNAATTNGILFGYMLFPADSWAGTTLAPMFSLHN